jgi:hypothetical protein
MSGTVAVPHPATRRAAWNRPAAQEWERTG